MQSEIIRVSPVIGIKFLQKIPIFTDRDKCTSANGEKGCTQGAKNPKKHFPLLGCYQGNRSFKAKQLIVNPSEGQGFKFHTLAKKLVLHLGCSAPQRHAWRGVWVYASLCVFVCVGLLVNRVWYLWVWSPGCARDCVLLLVLTDPRLMVWAFSLSSSSQVLHLSAKEL